MSDERNPVKMDLRVHRIDDTNELGPAFGIDTERGHILWQMVHQSLETMQDVGEALEYCSTLCNDVQELAFVCIVMGRRWREHEIMLFRAEQNKQFEQYFKLTT